MTLSRLINLKLLLYIMIITNYYLGCSGDIVPQCRYKRYTASYTEALWISCNVRNMYGNPWSFYLADLKDKEHTQKGDGLLMYDGGTVSGNKFDDETADLVCRIMGYAGVMGWSIDRKYMNQHSLPIHLKDLNCLTKTRAFPICTYQVDTTNSTHDDDIWLWCDMQKNHNLICPPGNRKGEKNTCTQCAPNTYSPDPNNKTSCLPCPRRSSSLLGSTSCSCDENFYMGLAGDKCLECPRNSHSMKGSDFCICEAGKYLHKDYNSCVRCPYGSVSKAGSMSAADCIECPEKAISINDRTVCRCEKGFGWEWHREKVGSCKGCPANFYKDRRQGICRQCPNKATSPPLSDECNCPEWLSWEETSSSCVDCKERDVVRGVCTCRAGTFWNMETNICETCPENHFSARFSTTCTKCPMFTLSHPRSSNCMSCPQGHYWDNYTCNACPENQVGNGVTCSSCAEGTYPSQDKTICQKPLTRILPQLSTTICALVIVVEIGNIIFKVWSKRGQAPGNDKVKDGDSKPQVSQREQATQNNQFDAYTNFNRRSTIYDTIGIEMNKS